MRLKGIVFDIVHMGRPDNPIKVLSSFTHDTMLVRRFLINHRHNAKNVVVVSNLRFSNSMYYYRHCIPVTHSVIPSCPK